MSELAGSECVADIEEVGRLYARDAVRVRRLVALDVSAPADVVEDACQVAWLRLVRHHPRIRRDAATRWVIRVARHEAYRHLDRRRREATLQEIEASEGEPLLPDLIEELVLPRTRLQSLSALSDRQQRLVWLQGLGFSYEEMAGATGDSRRTVERQLLRAKRRLGAGEARTPRPSGG